MEPLAIKVKYGDQLRRFNLKSNSFAEFSQDIRSIFQLDPNLPLVVKYLDDEGDEIIMSSDAELICAIDLLPASPARSLKVFVQIQQQQQLPGLYPSATPVQPMFYPYPVPVQPKEAWREAVKQRKMEKLEKKIEKKIEKKLDKLADRQEKAHIVRPLMARLVSHVTVPDGQEFGPDVAFTKTWKLRNDGTLPWNANFTFLRVSRAEDALNAPLSVPLGQEVAPGWEVDVTVAMKSPTQPGAYENFWRLTTPEGRKFGQRIRCKIAVVASSEDDSSSSEQKPSKESKQQYFAALRDKYQVQLTALHQMGFANCDRKLLKKLEKYQGNLDLVLNFIITRKKRQAGLEHKY
jgi:hypothetical protein